VPQAWTLGVELTFYAIAPFVCRRWWSAVGLLIFGTCVRYILATYFHLTLNSAWLYRFAPAEMMLFGAGSVAYFVGRLVCPRVPNLTKILGGTFVFLFAFAVFFDHPTIWVIDHIFGGGNSVSLLLSKYPILFLMAVAAPSLFYITKNNRVDSFLGELSYPMYISHIFVFSMINAYLPASVQAGNALYVACVITLSAILILLVINPIDRLRKLLAGTITAQTTILNRRSPAAA
jgi:peptidoglycan/LPS O-acetylase OafA/YrhL